MEVSCHLGRDVEGNLTNTVDSAELVNSLQNHMTKEKPSRNLFEVVKPKAVKRLFWDIEVSPNIVLAWRAGFGLDINHDSIIQERKVITIAYSWEEEDKVYVLTWDESQDDRAMLAAFTEVANEADELVAHYGNNFDLPWFRTRLLILGLEPIPKYKTVDTKAWASKYFYFNSNKLDYITKVLGHAGKIKTDYQLWKDITLNNCQKALAKMVKYNAEDVRLLKHAYWRMAPFCSPKTHAGVHAGLSKWTCSHCASENVAKSKTKTTAAGTIQHQMHCNACGSYYTISNTAHEEYLESKRKVQKV